MSTYYQEQLEKGLMYQDFIVEQFYKMGLPIINYSSRQYQYNIGETKCGFEIKFDDKLKTTGNIYIETAEKSNKDNEEYVASGIYRNDNTWLYIIGDYSKIFVFSKKQLQLVHQKDKFTTVQTATSQGFLLPVDVAEKVVAIKVIDIDDKIWRN